MFVILVINVLNTQKKKKLKKNSLAALKRYTIRIFSIKL